MWKVLALLLSQVFTQRLQTNASSNFYSNVGVDGPRLLGHIAPDAASSRPTRSYSGACPSN